LKLASYRSEKEKGEKSEENRRSLWDPFCPINIYEYTNYGSTRRRMKGPESPFKNTV
jgi:hypothetical protein